MKRTERLKEGDLIIGSPLGEDIYDRNGVLLLKKGFVINSEKQLTFLLRRGAGYQVDLLPEELKSPFLTPEKKDPTPFDFIDEVYSQLANLCRPQSIKLSFPSRILELGKKLQTACRLNLDAALGAVLLGKDLRYSITHQIHCALICEIISRQLDRPPPERLILLAAALTMNIAMLELQDLLFNQKEKLSPEIRREVRGHPWRGVDLLRSYGVEDEIWLKAVFQHHEFVDGSGYPEGLKGKSIEENARILTLADVYCVKLFSRAYRLPLPPDVAAREIITGSRGQSFDQDLTRILVKEIGLFHPGSLVRLINGEVAVVTQRGKKIHHPIVHSVLKENGLPFLKPVRRDCSRENYSIMHGMAPKHVTMDLDKNVLWGN
jgi:hypothetical protein